GRRCGTRPTRSGWSISCGTRARCHRSDVTGRARQADVIVAGGGPAGSVLAWDLARRGIDVLVLERTRFPREKVCGDYVEPRGLRILREMGCLEGLERTRPLPISRTSIFSEWQCRYSGPIPFY